MLAKMSLVNAFTHNRSSNTHCVVLMGQVHSVTLLHIKNPLFHENNNKRHLLEKAITFEQQGLFTTPRITDFASYGEQFDGKFLM